MTISLSKRAWARIITFLLATIAVLGIFSYLYYNQKEQAKRELKHTYVRGISDLSGHVENVHTNLTKSLYAGTPEQLETLTTNVWREAGYAKLSLSQLPASYFELGNTYKLLSQVGEYGKSLAKKVADGQELSEEERNNLSTLNDYCAELQDQILVLQDEINTGNINFDQVDRETDEDINQNANEQRTAGIDQGFKDFEDGIQSYPTLIYDGPFADNILEKKPELIKGKEEVTREQAREKASKASAVEVNELKDDTDEDGNMPLYCFYSGTVNVSVTKQGGYLAYMLNSRLIYEEKLDVETAKENARKYLDSLGIKDLTETYYEVMNNTMTVNYAAQDGDVTCYTDLVKVSVAMDNGEITGFDARGYITNHHERDYPQVKVDVNEAKESLSSLLTVEKVKLALIPTLGTNEKLTYEFTCTGVNNQRVLVYVNVENGDEEQILILIENEDGVLST